MMRPFVKDHVSGVTRNGEPGLINSGKTGMRIPNPSMSMRTVEKTARREFLRRIRASLGMPLPRRRDDGPSAPGN